MSNPELIKEISDRCGIGEDAITIFCDIMGIQPEEVEDDYLIDSYVGCYEEGLEECAEELVRDTVTGGDWLIEHGYVAYDRIARDLSYEGWYEKDGYVFRPA